MTQITESHYKALTQKIYDTLMELPEMGMGEMGECRDESDRIVEEWMEENNISLLQPKDESKEVNEGGELFTGGEWYRKWDSEPLHTGIDIFSDNGEQIVDFVMGSNLQEAEANAALIAQSKNMYYELKRVKKQCAEMVEWLDGGNKDFSVEEMLCSIANGITEILKKANPNY